MNLSMIYAQSNLFSDFLTCQKEHKVLGRFLCKTEILERNQCVRQFWNLPNLEERAYNEYLADRSHFRETGQSKVGTTEWIEKYTLRPKSWEEYSMQKDENPRLWNIILSKIRSERRSPNIAVQVDSKSLNDSQ